MKTALDAARKITIEELTSEAAFTAIGEAFRKWDGRAKQAFLLELEYLNKALPKLTPIELALASAQTGKDSLEELLGEWLPDWVKELLKVLNEIMDLV